MAYIGNSPGVSSQRIVTTVTATAGQTTFTPSSGYTVGYLDVYLNGIKLINGTDYTASDGSTVVLTDAVALDDVVELMAYIPRGLSDGYTKSEADARYEPLDSAYTKSESDARYMDINAVTLPTQTGNASKFLQTDGTDASLQVPAATEVSYSNTTSGISANTVQEAIDYLNAASGGGSGGSVASYTRDKFVATSGQTTFTTSNGYTLGYLQVFVNGILLDITDYSASDGSTVVLAVGSATGDEVVIIALDSFAIAEVLRVMSISASAANNSIQVASDNSLVVPAYVKSTLIHDNGYFQVGSYNTATYGDGHTRMYFDYNTNRLRMWSRGTDGSNNPLNIYLPYGGGVQWVGGGLLDDYDEGTWTPVISPLGTGTYSSWGAYTKIGNLVHIEGKVTVASNNGSGALTISGLPFTGVDNGDTAARPSAYPEGDYQNINNAINSRAHFRLNGDSMVGVANNGSGSTVYFNSTSVPGSFEFNFSVSYRSV